MAASQNVFQYTQLAEEANGLEGPCYPHLDHLVGLFSLYGMAAEENVPPLWHIVAGDAVEDCGLACTVGTDEAHNGALVHGKGHFVQGHESTKDLGDGCNFKKAHSDFSLAWALARAFL